MRAALHLRQGCQSDSCAEDGWHQGCLAAGEELLGRQRSAAGPVTLGSAQSPHDPRTAMAAGARPSQTRDALHSGRDSPALVMVGRVPGCGSEWSEHHSWVSAMSRAWMDRARLEEEQEQEGLGWGGGGGRARRTRAQLPSSCTHPCMHTLTDTTCRAPVLTRTGWVQLAPGLAGFYVCACGS